MGADKKNPAYRDFAGRAPLINLFRVVHLVGLAGLSAAVLGNAGHAAAWGGVMLASGLGIMALDIWSNPAYVREGRGLAVFVKLALLVVMMGWEAARLPLFWFILAASTAISHAPGRFRHRQFF